MYHNSCDRLIRLVQCSRITFSSYASEDFRSNHKSHAQLFQSGRRTALAAIDTGHIYEQEYIFIRRGIVNSIVIGRPRNRDTKYDGAKRKREGPKISLLLKITWYLLHPFHLRLCVPPLRAPWHVFVPVIVPLALVTLSPLIEPIPVPTSVFHAHISKILLVSLTPLPHQRCRVGVTHEVLPDLVDAVVDMAHSLLLGVPQVCCVQVQTVRPAPGPQHQPYHVQAVQVVEHIQLDVVVVLVAWHGA